MATTPTPRRTTARKPATANGKAPAATANGKANAPAKAPAEPGYRRYATAEVPAAMTMFSRWISREFPELGAVDPRLVTIASKCYRYAQSSDLNR